MKLHPPLVFLSVLFFIQHFCFILANVVPTERKEQHYANETTSQAPPFGPVSESESSSTKKPVIFVTSEPVNKSEKTIPEKPVAGNRTNTTEMEITADELLNLLSEGRTEPVIVYPKEHEDLATILLPLTEKEKEEFIRCPYCGTTQHIHVNHLTARNEPCAHCNRCGHALRYQEFVKSGRLMDENLLNHKDPYISLATYTATTPKTVEVANISLTRKDIIRRRLNYQRIQKYLKSIGPEKNSRSTGTMAYMPQQYYQARTSYNNYNPTKSPHAPRSSFWDWSWLFGGKEQSTDNVGAEEPPKKTPEIRSPLIQYPQTSYYNPAASVGAQNSGGYRCPYMTYQAQRKRK